MKMDFKELFESKKAIEKDLHDNCNDIDIDLSNFETWNQLMDYVQDNRLLEGEIIYYSNAIEYLKNNDPSLNDSIEIAVEYGYELQNVNSELLASLLYSRELEEEFYSYESTITDYYDESENSIIEIDAKIEELEEMGNYYIDHSMDSKAEKAADFISVLEDIKSEFRK